jgi:molecular chaperone GrpE (heat shock protein)
MANVSARSDKFAAVMQQLSAEAEKVLPTLCESDPIASVGTKDGADIHKQFESLAGRVQGLETALSERLDRLASAISAANAVDLAPQWKKIDEQLSAIRSTGSINQQLFDSLHAELLKYRDNFLHESLQKPFIHDLVNLYDDLTALGQQLRNASEERAGKRGHIAQWRDNLENSIHSLVEILHRFEVNEIEAKERVDRSYHKILSYEPADFPEEDGCIVMRVKRGFVWRGKLLRPEEVIAKRFS